MSEQTGSASKTKRPLLPPQESESLNISPLTSNQNLLRFLIFVPRLSANSLSQGYRKNALSASDV
jgi:hypothetical protein